MKCFSKFLQVGVSREVQNLAAETILYRVHDARYMMYWPISTHGRKLEAKQKALDGEGETASGY
jgi:hypothetical protein